MWVDFDRSVATGLKNPALIVAISTSLPQYRALYSQARESGRFMLSKMDFSRIATIHSSCLAPEVTVGDDGVATLLGCYLHLARGKRDIVLLTGDSSPMEDQYQFARMVLSYAKELGVKEMYSIGARWAENPLSPEAEPQPNGFATDEVGVGSLKKVGVKIIQEEPAPFFASIVVGLAAEYGMRGYKISVDHGEPSPHPRSVARILGTLSALVGFELSTEELRSLPPTPPQATQVGDDSIYH